MDKVATTLNSLFIPCTLWDPIIGTHGRWLELSYSVVLLKSAKSTVFPLNVIPGAKTNFWGMPYLKVSKYPIWRPYEAQSSIFMKKWGKYNVKHNFSHACLHLVCYLPEDDHATVL